VQLANLFSLKPHNCFPNHWNQTNYHVFPHSIANNNKKHSHHILIAQQPIHRSLEALANTKKMSETINFSKRKTLETEISFHQTAITTIFVISVESDKREMQKKKKQKVVANYSSCLSVYRLTKTDI
jgi:hypothetical protein